MKLAVIPARGGSKRIPGKNIRYFCGKPIIAYSIEVALQSGLFDHVAVSTDDEDIAAVARDFGAEVPFIRPPEISDDHTGTNAVVKHAIRWYLAQGHDISLVCCIYATAPFVSIGYLKEGHDKLVDSRKSFAFSVASFPSPIQRALRINKKGEVESLIPENINRRSQDLEETYHDAGQFYWGLPEAFLDDEITHSTASVPVILPRYLVQDIDTEQDWKLAELMFERLQLMKDKFDERL